MTSTELLSLSNKTKNSKELIIQALGNEWPLTAKQIHTTLKREYGANSSYQAVHKATAELAEHGVLQKIDGKFRISYEWAENISKLGQKLKSNLGNQNGNAKSDNPAAMEFNSFVQYGKFIINEFYDESLNPEHKNCMCFWNHAYPIMGISKEEHENLKRMFSRETHYNMCGGSTFLDRMSSGYLEKLGKKCVLGVRVPTKIDTFVNGDYIMQGYFTKEFEKEFDSLYRRVKSEKDFDLKTVFEFSTKPTKIRAIIFRNKEFAEMLSKESEELFEKQKKAGK